MHTRVKQQQIIVKFSLVALVKTIGLTNTDSSALNLIWSTHQTRLHIGLFSDGSWIKSISMCAACCARVSAPYVHVEGIQRVQQSYGERA